VPPKLLIDKNFKDTIVLRTNSSTIIEVPFQACPMPIITWTFNDGKFSDSRRITEETIRGMSALTISRAERKDAGIYKLVIRNDLGTVKLVVSVIVKDKPSAPTHLTTSNMEADSLVINWEEPEDNGGCDITNYVIEKREHNRRTFQPIGTSRDRSFKAIRLSSGQSYVFQVVAENECGRGPTAETETVNLKSPYGKHQFLFKMHLYCSTSRIL
jgi:titin